MDRVAEIDPFSPFESNVEVGTVASHSRRESAPWFSFRSPCGLVALLALPLGSLAAQGYPGEEAARRMTVPEGFAVDLVAGEPLVRQPVAIDFDDRGRLWVIQYLQYPNPAGLKRVKVDRYSRTVYDRVPEPPPRGPRGDDRITILEDADGDGRADRARDFVAGLNLASGFAFGHGGVYVLQAPYLLFYPDRDRDDIPDGDPETHLAFFGMEDAHSVANSLAWGPDGWLYGCQGSTVTARVRGIEFQQGVWRYEPRSGAFELFCEGGGNSWGLDFDRRGDLFYSTNFGGYAMLHGVQGAYYWKQFTKHGELHNPYAFGYFDHVPHRGMRGGHVTVGGIVYEGDGFPESFRGTYIGADLLGHAVYWHRLERRGSTFAAAYEGDLLQANDTWFAPSDVTLGPDGAVYLADWHDRRMAHPDPDAEWDRTNGRIYRIRYGPRRPISVPDVHALPAADLVALLEHPNAWQARLARREIAERRDAAALRTLRALTLGEGDPGRALRALWALAAAGGLDDALAGRLLEHPDEDLRRWTVRLLGDRGDFHPRIGFRLVELAANDPSVLVRSQIASTAKRLPQMWLALVDPILRRDLDAADPHLPLLLWWAVEAHADTERETTLAHFAGPLPWEQPFARQAVLPRLVRRYAAAGGGEGFGACARLLAEARNAADRDLVLGALEQGLQGRRLEQPPAALEPWLAAEWQAGSRDPLFLRLAARLGLAAARAEILRLARDPRAAENARLEYIAILGERGAIPGKESKRDDDDDGDDTGALLELLGRGETEAIELAALRALGRIAGERGANAVLAAYGGLRAPVRKGARALLFSRRTSALAYLQAVDRGEVPAAETAVEELRALAAHDDPAIDALARKHWGSVTGGTSEEKLADVRRFANDLRAAPGDPARGRPLFAKHCGRCHLLHGEGSRIGPDLTFVQRRDRDQLLVSTVDPGATVRREYLSYVVQTRDGRVFTGLLGEGDAAAATVIIGADGERRSIARDEILAVSESPLSLMPENLLAPLAPQELRDLFSFLESDAPAAAAAPAANKTKPSGGQ